MRKRFKELGHSLFSTVFGRKASLERAVKPGLTGVRIGDDTPKKDLLGLTFLSR